ncbi:protein argonaute 4-like [Gossypium australe]|uniref:Protein argonaute 4-like n=1 Tax=Gossypium australe TaxID=47621 RepID=A0A5B6VXW5_9ROSI|nr:protein argonaute 4-like [Gossypium australe]
MFGADRNMKISRSTEGDGCHFKVTRCETGVFTCLPIFQDNQSNFTDIGGGALGYRGFHSIRCGFFANQNAIDPYSLDWTMAKRSLKNLWIKVNPSNHDMKNANGEAENPEITAYNYFRPSQLTIALLCRIAML